MRLQTVPAGRGALWVQQGFRVFFKRPLAFALLFAASIMLAAVLAKLAPALIFVVLPLVPLASLGFMIATRTVLEGGFPTPRVFIDPLRVERRRVVAQLQLGLIYTAATFAIMGLGELVDSGPPEILLESATSAASAPGAGMAVAPGALLGLLLRFALAGLLSIPFWHAPALVHWDGHGCAKALFSSTLACWRNRGAFAVYGLVWFGFIMGFSLVAGLVLALLGQPQMLISASVPLSLIVATIFYASLYFTFADCFVANGGEAIGRPTAGAA